MSPSHCDTPRPPSLPANDASQNLPHTAPTLHTPDFGPIPQRSAPAAPLVHNLLVIKPVHSTAAASDAWFFTMAYLGESKSLRSFPDLSLEESFTRLDQMTALLLPADYACKISEIHSALNLFY